MVDKIEQQQTCEISCLPFTYKVLKTLIEMTKEHKIFVCEGRRELIEKVS